MAELEAGPCGAFPEPTRLEIKSAALWGPLCEGEGEADASPMTLLMRRLRDSYQHKTTLKAYAYTPWSRAGAGGDADITAAEDGSMAEGGVYQVGIG